MASDDEPGTPHRDAVSRRPTPARPPATPDDDLGQLRTELAEVRAELEHVREALKELPG